MVHVVWMERMRQMDDSVRAWSNPTQEATLMHHLGLLEMPPVPDAEQARPDDDLVVTGTMSWADMVKQFEENPVKEPDA